MQRSGDRCYEFWFVRSIEAKKDGGSEASDGGGESFGVLGHRVKAVGSDDCQGDDQAGGKPIFFLSLIEDPARRRTLIARKVSSDTWHLDIRLQGGNETVFMEI